MPTALFISTRMVFHPGRLVKAPGGFWVHPDRHTMEFPVTNFREPPEGDWVYTRYITRNGKRIYHPRGGLFRFRAKPRRPN